MFHVKHQKKCLEIINQCYQFDARGISYATWYADFTYTFEEMCEVNGVEYIEPTNIKK